MSSALLRVLSAAHLTNHMNYELFGNTNPHLHWPIVPRYKTDSRWGQPIWEGYPRSEFKINRQFRPNFLSIYGIDTQTITKVGEGSRRTTVAPPRPRASPRGRCSHGDVDSISLVFMRRKTSYADFSCGILVSVRLNKPLRLCGWFTSPDSIILKYSAVITSN